jgi:hypothetical protein
MQTNLDPVAPEELMAYLEGELPVDRAAEVAAHLQECRECQILAAELKSVSEGLNAWTVEPKESPINPDLALALDEFESQSQTAESGIHWNWPKSWTLRRLGPWLGGAFAGGVAALLLTLALIDNLGRGERGAAPSGRSAGLQQSAVSSEAMPAAPPVGGDRDALAFREMTSLSEAQRVELMKRQQNAELSSNLAVTSAGPVASQAASSAAILAPPMILRTAQVTVITQDLDKARDGMDRVVQKYSGYVGDLSAAAPSNGPRKLTATLRVPAAQLDAALAEIKTLGRVESELQNGQDVTAQYVDLQARLSNSRNTEQRLVDLLRQRTGKLSDVLEVETELSRVREEIERMEGERRLMSKQVEFATLTTTLSEEFKSPAGAAPDSLGTRFRNAAVDGYQTVAHFIVGVALLLVSNGPVLLLWAAILFFPARYVWRKLRDL